MTLHTAIAPAPAEDARRRDHRRLLAVGAGILVVLIGCAITLYLGPLRPGRNQPQAAVVTVQPAQKISRHQLALVHRASALARRSPASFGGGWWDEAKGWPAFGVLSADQLAATRATLDKKHLQDVHIEVVKNSLSRLASLDQALTQAPSPLHDAFVSAAPDLYRNQVVVTVTTITPKIRRQVAAIAGFDAVLARSSTQPANS